MTFSSKHSAVTWTLLLRPKLNETYIRNNWVLGSVFAIIHVEGEIKSRAI